MYKLFTVTILGSLSVLLAGCLWQRPTDVENMEPDVTIQETMEAAEITPEETETQMVSEDDELTTIESELDATVILDEDLSNL